MIYYIKTNDKNEIIRISDKPCDQDDIIIESDKSIDFLLVNCLYKDGTIIKNDNMTEAKKNMLRYHRATLLDAFDKWEKAVIRGREADSEEIMKWYNDLLDLKEETFDNIPDKIKYYLN